MKMIFHVYVFGTHPETGDNVFELLCGSFLDKQEAVNAQIKLQSEIDKIEDSNTENVEACILELSGVDPYAIENTTHYMKLYKELF